MKKWMSEDERVIGIVGGSEMILNSVSVLRKKTIEDREESDCGGGWGKGVKEGEEGEEEGEEREEEEEGVSVREKNGILAIVLEVVEGGGWMGEYGELEEVVSRLEEEGKKRWKEKREEKRSRGGDRGREWKEMGRLAHDILWGIEEKKNAEEGIVTFGRMKTSIEEEKRLREASEVRVNEERRRADEEERKREESERGREEEKKRADEEKRRMEERIQTLEREMNEMKRLTEYPVIKSLSEFNLHSTNTSILTVQNNTITHVGSSHHETCIFKDILKAVCIYTLYSILFLLLSS